MPPKDQRSGIKDDGTFDIGTFVPCAIMPDAEACVNLVITEAADDADSEGHVFKSGL